MRKALAALVVVVLATLSLTGTAQAQDSVTGTIVAEPAQVPAAGEYTMSATGSDFIPDTQILLVKCTSPADTLVPGTSTMEEITEAALAISALEDCDIAAAQNVDVDSDGGWTAELTAEVGDNFFLSAGALDGSQAGATWIPIVGDAAAADDGGEEEAADDEAADDDAEADDAEADDGEEEADDEAEATDDGDDAALAETGVETGLLGVIGAAVLGAGVLVAREGRRLRS